MKHRELEDLKNDKSISPEDVAQFALYENDLNDSAKFTAICDLVVCCERSQTDPLKQRITQLEKQNSELREVLGKIISTQSKVTSFGSSAAYREAHQIAEQALKPKGDE